MIEIDFTAHQAVCPDAAHHKALAKHMRVTALVSATDEDHAASDRRLRVKLKAPGHRLVCWCGFSNSLGARTVRSDVTLRACLQLREPAHTVAQPHFGLPQGVEAF